MKTTKLIGIVGKARSGKDAISKHLFAKHAFTRIALADPLKLAAQHIFGLSDEQALRDEFKEIEIPFWGMSPRQMFQRLGTEAAKTAFGDDVWCKRWELTYNMLKGTDDIVVPDVRFDVEYDMIKRHGGIIIEVIRGPGLVGSTGLHASERGISYLPDYTIDNNGTLDMLHVTVDTIVGAL